VISKFLQQIAIKRLQAELNRAKKEGHIIFLTDVTDIKVPGGDSQKIGIEIIFSDSTTDRHIGKIRDYIEGTYKFKVNTSLVETGKMPKILIVEY
jgi:hypothetical protein